MEQLRKTNFSEMRSAGGAKMFQQHLLTEGFYEKVVSNANDSILITEADQIDTPGPRIVYAKQAFYEMTGYNEEEVLGKTPRMLQGAKTDRKELDKIRRRLEDNRSVKAELINYKKDGTEFHVEFIIAPIANEEGMVSHFLSIQRDVTEKSIVQKQMEDKELFSRTLLESSSDCLKVLDLDGGIRYINQNGVCILEAEDRSFFEGRKWESLWEEEELALVSNAVQQGLRGETVHFRAPANTSKSNLKWWDVMVTPVLDYNNKVVNILASSRDITSSVMATKKIEDSEKMLRQVADLMPGKVGIIADNKMPVFMNGAWVDYFGMTLEEVQAYGWTNFIHPEDLKQFMLLYQQAMEKETGLELECRILDRNKKYHWHIVKGVAIKNNGSQLNHWIYSSTEIQKIKDEDQRKTEFIKMVCHELKTPVTSIKGYTQMLLSIISGKWSVPLEKAAFENPLVRIDIQTNRLIQLINEMLDLSRLDENKLKLYPELFRIDELVKETLEDLQYINHRFTINLFCECQLSVYADKNRIQQVLINLINNAVKYSPGKNLVDISINLAGDNSHVVIAIKDDGIGIREEDQKKIFDRFYRAEGDSEKRFAGFGIGLFISKQIIEMHKGRIEVQSEENKGSVFSIYLPFHS